MNFSKRRIGVNERALIEARRRERANSLLAWLRRTLRASKIGMAGLVVLALAATCGWGVLAWWHHTGGGVLRAVECRGEGCRGGALMNELGLELGMPMEDLKLAAVRARVLDDERGGRVSVAREFGSGKLVLEVERRPLLARFRPAGTGTWWVLSSGGMVEPLEARAARIGYRESTELPIVEAEGRVDWRAVAGFLEALRADSTLWNELSELKISKGGGFADAWLVSCAHRLVIRLDDEGIVGLGRYYRYLRNRPELQNKRTIDLRFGGFAYVS